MGEHVQVQKTPPDEGMGNQPVGSACAEHCGARKKAMPFMSWPDFAGKYRDEPEFKVEVDGAVAKMQRPSQQQQGVEAQIADFVRQSVVGKRDFDIVVEPPPCLPRLEQRPSAHGDQHRSDDAQVPTQVPPCQSAVLGWQCWNGRKLIVRRP